MDQILKAIGEFLETTGIAKMFSGSTTPWWQYLIMYCIIGALFYLAIVKKFEPLLLMPIAFGMLLANLPGAELMHLDYFFDDHYIAFENFDFSSAEYKSQLEEFIKYVDSDYSIAFKDYFAVNGESVTFNMSNMIQAYESTGAFNNNEEIISHIRSIFESRVPGAYWDTKGIFEAFKSNSTIALENYIHVIEGSIKDQFTSFISHVEIYKSGEAENLVAIRDFMNISGNGIELNFQGLAKAYENIGVTYYSNTNVVLNHVSSLFENYIPDASLDVDAAMKALETSKNIVLSSFIHVDMSTMIGEVVNHGGLLDILYLGVKLGIYPSLIFLGVGAMTDFSPLIANPKSLLMGAGAQFGVFAAFFFALFIGFTPMEAGAIGIIGGADGPTAILVTKELAPQLLGAIAIAAYSYMALIPIIQPPFMKLLTTEKERKIKMTNLRPVSKTEKVIFPIIVTAIVCLIIPDAAPLVGFLMLGNLFNVSGVADRLSKTSQNELINIVTICLGVSVGATANASSFLKPQTIYIIGLGLAAFCISTIGGLITGKIMCKVTKGKINPLIGSAGVSAVPMAARVAQDVGRKYDPSNFLLMHAMGPNVAGVIGSAVAAGVFLSFLG